MTEAAYDVVIRGGRIATASDTFDADLGITGETIAAIGRALKDRDGAQAIVMGCAGMARHRRPLEEALGIPVIDPTQAAVTMALGAVQFAQH